MTLTKKNFIAIAEILARSKSETMQERESTDTKERIIESNIIHTAFYNIVSNLCDYFQEENHLFNSSKFTLEYQRLYNLFIEQTKQ